MKELWLFNVNRRIYPKAPPGRIWASGGPIYREHWERHEVVGENRRSWITKHGHKVPKAGGHGIAFTQQEVDDNVWVKEHRIDIANAIQSCESAEALRQIAKIINFKPKHP